ncbi:hypothetical protein EC9_20690 [Rosistilla ulvae]|uniref:Uncharacterized protein n=1 Tax=Rosistilla ulvae TaxID=1930277 RepID=A0A517LZ36_9BACT|nr:hypothetical protein [Rosistilla ulvae]QDS87886.1 hypothetical protein EC9_20690 [Rosistilla ulvae]
MTILRRIRHALFASIAAFLLAILFVPTDSPRTVWSIADANHADAPQRVIASGTAVTPIRSQSRLPQLLTARLRWRLRMTQHYADRDMTRQFNQAVAAVEESADEPATTEATMTLTSYRQSGSPEGDVPAGSGQPDELLTGHDFWTRQHDRAAAAYEELLALDKPTAVATPVTTLPGLPTTRGLWLAALCGLLGGLTMAGVDWLAYRQQPRDEAGHDETLHLPASWFHVRRTPFQRLAQAIRTVCILWIVVTGLLLVGSARKEMGMQRLTKWPLAELADLV